MSVFDEFRARLLKLDSSALSDAIDSFDLGEPRAISGLSRVNGGKLAGPVFTVSYTDRPTPKGRFHNAGTYIDDVSVGHVVLIDSQGRTSCTNWGSLLTAVALRNNLAGTVIHGAVRDIDEIRKSDYPLYATAINAVSGKNRTNLRAVNEPVKIGDVTVNPGDWLFADGSAVLLLPAHNLKQILHRAEAVSATEELIANAIKSGTPLRDARKTYRYDQPWKTNV